MRGLIAVDGQVRLPAVFPMMELVVWDVPTVRTKVPEEKEVRHVDATTVFGRTAKRFWRSATSPATRSRLAMEASARSTRRVAMWAARTSSSTQAVDSGKKVMILAGAVREIHPDTETVFVDRTKDEIKNAPEYDEDRFADQGYRDQLGRYYGDRK